MSPGFLLWPTQVDFPSLLKGHITDKNAAIFLCSPLKIIQVPVSDFSDIQLPKCWPDTTIQYLQKIQFDDSAKYHKDWSSFYYVITQINVLHSCYNLVAHTVVYSSNTHARLNASKKYITCIHTLVFYYKRNSQNSLRNYYR